ncbi:helix-turn-helix domain-containing protein [Streptomyces alkaliphilus]|nr:helix-turn-helix transcriptional regulator [Streptomyces alkaliphilus]
MSLMTPEGARTGEPGRGGPGTATGPTVPRMMLGAELRRLREQCGVTGSEAGDVIRASHSKISRLEAGRTGFKTRDVADLLTLYGVTDEADRATLLALAEQANTPGWWHTYHDVVPRHLELFLGLEQAADMIRSYELQFIPGLLQTEDYARELFRLTRDGETDRTVERRVELRIERRRALHRVPPVKLWVVIDEAALRRPLGGPRVHRAQLRHLLEMSELPNVTIQVMPFSAGGHPAMGGPIMLLRPPVDDLPDIVYLEQPLSGHYVDRTADVEHYRHVMNQLVIEAASTDASRAMIAGMVADL